MPLALIALAIAAFAVGVSEFAIMGLLPDVATGVDVSIPTAGNLITGYAIGVIVGAPLMTALSTRWARKVTLLTIIGLLVVGNVASALAPDYTTLMAARLVSGVPQGVFFGVGTVVAADLVPAEKRAKAMSIMFGGFTLANVIGVPLGTLLGQQAGWRVTFWAIAGIGLVAMAGVFLLVRYEGRPDEVGLRQELASFKSPQVWIAMGMTMLGFGGVFASFTYVTPMMTKVAGFDEGSMTPIMVVFGLGMTAGNLLSGRFAGRHLMRSIYVFLGSMAVVLVLFVFTAHDKVLALVTLFLLGMFGFANVPALQMRILDKASGAPTLAAAANLSAFNVANALGAFLGGLAIDQGYGYASPNGVGAALAAGGLVLALISGAADRKEAAPRPQPQQATSTAP
ncbi:MFS transporter [Streptomyces eurythermus]|uniref:MFS transporter n=1 Tax=Streptomyces eurythermus TaxID=42237 RepID=UPI0036FCDA9D